MEYSTSLFQTIPGFEPSAEYIHYRDSAFKSDVRAFIDKMFLEAGSFIGDSHFRKMFQKEFHQTTWQLYVTWSFHRFGTIPLMRSKQEGPDIVLKDGTIVEVILASRGQGQDKAFAWSDQTPQLKNENFTIHHPHSFTFPDPQIVMRITNAASAKLIQYKKWLKNKIVAPSQPFVIAINAGLIDEAKTDFGNSYACVASFGIGENIFEASVSMLSGSTDLESIRTRALHRSTVQKKSGGLVDSCLFLSPVFSEISAVLYSSHSIDNAEALRPPSDIEIVVNGFAKNPVQGEFLKGALTSRAVFSENERSYSIVKTRI